MLLPGSWELNVEWELALRYEILVWQGAQDTKSDQVGHMARSMHLLEVVTPRMTVGLKKTQGCVRWWYSCAKASK